MSKIRIAAAALLMFFCGSLTAAAQAANANDTARLLAGMPVPANSPLAKYADDPAWKQHAQYFNAAWKKLDETQLSKIRGWSAENIKETQPTLYYMFSGPDFLYANAFFPKAKTYVLAGLESVGPVPEINMHTRYALSNLRESMNSVLNYSFFITRHMKEQLHEGELSGTLPILYVFLARAGKDIREVTLFHLEKDGSILPASAVSRGRAFGKSGGAVKIVFADSDGSEHTLYYFSTDLSDPGVKMTGFLPFCEKLAPADSILKSASYLMHGPGFETIRAFILDHSRKILQDDSGIPVRFFKPNDWALSFFGRYLTPLSIFPKTNQPQLKEIFANAPKIDFGFGYRHRANESNLMLATRKAQESNR